MRSILICGFVWLLLSPSMGQAADAKAIQIGSERQLFFDDRLVEESRGLQRTWHQPVKEPTPVLKKTQQWEGMGPYVYGTVLRDPASGHFKIWYNCYVGGHPDYFTCYATSKDGLHWDRPACDVVQDPRLPAGNNVVMLGSGLPGSRQCISPSVLLRPDEPDPSRRYAMVYWDINAGRPVKFFGLCLAYSPDGIHWKNAPENPVFTGPSDVTDAQYDAARRRYLLHYKVWRVEGDVLSSTLPRGTASRVSYWPTWDSVKLKENGVRFEGQMIDFASNDTSPMNARVHFAREPSSRRVVARAESKDLIHWTDARVVLDLPEKGDPSDWSTYGMSTFSYEGYFLGLLRVFHNGREIDLELAMSDDDRNWKRTTPRNPFIPLGSKDRFDAGMVFSANSPVEVGNELWFYYGAFTGDHEAGSANQTCSIGLAKLRRDGFVSLNAEKETGELTTVPIRFGGKELVLNASAAKGSVSAEIRDERGEPHPGFTFGDCDEIRSDAVSRVVKWKGNADIGKLAGQPVRVCLRIRNADLYAIQFR